MIIVVSVTPINNRIPHLRVTGTVSDLFCTVSFLEQFSSYSAEERVNAAKQVLDMLTEPETLAYITITPQPLQ